MLLLTHICVSHVIASNKTQPSIPSALLQSNFNETANSFACNGGRTSYPSSLSFRRLSYNTYMCHVFFDITAVWNNQMQFCCCLWLDWLFRHLELAACNLDVVLNFFSLYVCILATIQPFSQNQQQHFCLAKLSSENTVLHTAHLYSKTDAFLICSITWLDSYGKSNCVKFLCFQLFCLIYNGLHRILFAFGKCQIHQELKYKYWLLNLVSV